MNKISCYERLRLRGGNGRGGATPRTSTLGATLLEIPQAPAEAEEVEGRRTIAQDVIKATRESDNLAGKKRVEFIERK